MIVKKIYALYFIPLLLGIFACNSLQAMPRHVSEEEEQTIKALTARKSTHAALLKKFTFPTNVTGHIFEISPETAPILETSSASDEATLLAEPAKKYAHLSVMDLVNHGVSIQAALKSVASGNGTRHIFGPRIHHSTSASLVDVDPSLPIHVDLRTHPHFPTEIIDQGDVGDCTAAATTTCMRIKTALQGSPEGGNPNKTSIFFNYALSRMLFTAKQNGLSLDEIMPPYASDQHGLHVEYTMRKALSSDTGSFPGFAVLVAMQDGGSITDLPKNATFPNDKYLYTDGPGTSTIEGMGFGIATDAAWPTPDGADPASSPQLSSLPNSAALLNGLLHRITAAKFLGASSSTDPDNEKLMSAIVTELKEGNPVTMGIAIFEEWIHEKTPIITAGTKVIGGHDITIIGATKDYLIVQNSWGRAEWLDKDASIMPTFPLNTAPTTHEIVINDFDVQYPSGLSGTQMDAISQGDILEIKGPKRTFSSETGEEIWTPARSLYGPSLEILPGETLLRINALRDMSAGHYLYGLFSYGTIVFVYGSDADGAATDIFNSVPFPRVFTKPNREYLILKLTGDGGSGIFYLPRDYPIGSAISIQGTDYTPS